MTRRGRMPHRTAPRPVALAIEQLEHALAPDTPLARVQSAWVATVGEAIAAEARPTAVHEGVLQVACSSGVWAQELDLLGPAVADGLNAQLGAEAIRSLRCRIA